jgi:hypothetical protein
VLLDLSPFRLFILLLVVFVLPREKRTREASDIKVTKKAKELNDCSGRRQLQQRQQEKGESSETSVLFNHHEEWKRWQQNSIANTDSHPLLLEHKFG